MKDIREKYPLLFKDQRDLIEEAEMLKARAQELVEAKQERLQAEYIIMKLDQALAAEAKEELEAAVEEAFDKIMEIESG